MNWRRCRSELLALEEEQAESARHLSDPEFYKSAGAGVVQINARLAELELEL